MRRGRPSLRATVREDVSHVLARTTYPVTVRTIQRYMGAAGARPPHWCTIKKCLDELADEGIVLRQSLPAEPKRKPLIVYLLLHSSASPLADRF